MSSFIVVEALGLVTFWGLGRIVRGAQHLFGGSRKKAKASAGVGTGAEDPVRSA